MDAANTQALDDWFVNQVLPLESALLRFLRHHWRGAEEVNDLRQDVYVRIYEAGATMRPANVKAFVFATARNLMIDKIRRGQTVQFESLPDTELSDFAIDDMTPERHYAARSELRLLQNALSALPPACRQVVELRKISGLSQKEVAEHLGIAEGTVEKQISKGIRLLAQAMLEKPHIAIVRTGGSVSHKALQAV